MLSFLNKDVLDMPGLTQEILNSFEEAISAPNSDVQEFESSNGDILYYYKEKPYNEYRLAAIYTKQAEFFQFGIVKPYKLNSKGETMKEVHENSDYIKDNFKTPEKEKEPTVDTPVNDDVDKEPEIIQITEPNSLQTDTYVYEGETYYMEDFRWEPGQQGDTVIQMFGKEGSNRKIMVKRPIVPSEIKDKPDITELTLHYKPEDPFIYDGKTYSRVSSMDKMIQGSWRPSYIYYNQELNEQLHITVIENVEDVASEIDKPEELKIFNFDNTLFTALTLEDYEVFSKIEKMIKNKKFQILVPGQDHISFAKIMNIGIYSETIKVLSIRGVFVDKAKVAVTVHNLYTENAAMDEEFDLTEIENRVAERISDIIKAYQVEEKVISEVTKELETLK